MAENGNLNENLAKCSPIELTDSIQSWIAKRLKTIDTCRSLADQLHKHDKNVHISSHVRESITVLDSGFHAVDSGFQLLDSGFQHSGFRIPERAGFQFFSFLMLFFAFRFRVRILLYWKTLLECITSLLSFSIYKLREECITLRKGFWYNNEGEIGGLSTPHHRGKK